MDEPKIDHTLRIADLIAAHLDGRSTPANEAELTEWLNENNLNRALFDRLTDEHNIEKNLYEFGRFDTEAALTKVKSRLANGQPKPTQLLWPRIAAAASIIVMLSVGGYFLFNKTHDSPLTAHYYKNDIPPGHDQATLTLADGRKIILRKGLNGTLAKQAGSTIRANANAITYNNASSSSERMEGEVMNTLTTKRGEQSPYPLVLADGTKVWLNAESSLTFPAEFKGNNRTVKLTGEAYFEVVHNAAKPFRVMAGGNMIEDIGTAFDINSYADEPVFKTTLLQGAVKLIPSYTPSPLERAGVRLNAGQQAVISASSPFGRTGGGVKIISVDPQSSIAWKNGQFRLDEQRLDEIMRQAARWYDIDVVYQDGSLRSEAFGGVTARYANVSQLLHALELTKQVRFQIDGRRITVMKK